MTLVIIIIKLPKKISIKLDKTEIIICAICILIGICSLLKLAYTNPTYIFPTDKYGDYVKNLYFNADVDRGIEDIINIKELTHRIHPLYRILILPFVLPLIFLQRNLSIYGIGYVILLLQITFNSISAILIYKILKLQNISKNICILSTLMFIFSFQYFWISVFPETYSITLYLFKT